MTSGPRRGTPSSSSPGEPPPRRRPEVRTSRTYQKWVCMMGLVGMVWLVWWVLGWREGSQTGLKIHLRLGGRSVVLDPTPGSWEVLSLTIEEESGSVGYGEVSYGGRDVYDGLGPPQGENIEQKLTETGKSYGVPAKRLHSFVQTSMQALIKGGMVPMFSFDIEVGRLKKEEGGGGAGVLGRVSYFYGEDLEEVVAEFCERHGVKGEQVLAVQKAVEVEATRRRVIPELAVDFRVMDQPEGAIREVRWELFRGEDMNENLKRFDEKLGKYGLAPKAVLVRHMAMGRIIPILIITVPQIIELGSKPRSPLSCQVMEQRGLYKPQAGPDVQRPENLTLYAGDDYSSEITAFLDVHRLTYGARAKLVAQAHRAAVVNGVEPVASLRINIGHYDSSMKGKRGVMELYHGLGVLESVADFCKTHGLSNDTRGHILSDAKIVLGNHRSRVEGVLELTYHNTKDEVFPLSIPIQEGANIEELISGVASKVNVPDMDMQWVHDGIVKEATKLKALPALSFRVDVPQGWAPLNIHVEQNMSFVVEDFLKDMGIKERHNTVFCKVARSAIARQLIPAATAEIKVSSSGWHGPSVMYVDLHDGDDAASAVQAMEDKAYLSATQQVFLTKDLQKRLDEEFTKLPEEAVLMNLGGLNVSLPMFDGENWKESIERAKEYPVWGEPLTPPERDMLEVQAKDMYVELGVAPAVEFNVKIKDQGVLPFPLYIDETVPEAVARFAKTYNLSERQVTKVTWLAQRKAVDSRLFPAFAVNVTVPGGKAPLRFYVGDNINATVKEFGRTHGFSEKRIERLTRDAVFRAGRARTMPIFSVNYTDDGVIHQVDLYHGDRIGTVASKFATRHGVDRDDLHEVLTTCARGLRFMPLWSIPVKVMSESGVEEVLVDVFQGDDIEILAKDFISSRGLAVDPSLMANIVKSQLAEIAAAGDSNGFNDALCVKN